MARLKNTFSYCVLLPAKWNEPCRRSLVDSLPDFEESVRKQETLSARVTDIAKELNVFARTGADSHLPHTSDSLMSEIKAASSTLQTLNQRYGALLQHSSRSVALMVSLSTRLGEILEKEMAPGRNSRPGLARFQRHVRFEHFADYWHSSARGNASRAERHKQ